MPVIEVSQSEQYIPEWGGNKKRAPADQITVEIDFPTVADMNELKSIKFGAGRDGEDQYSIWFDRPRILKRYVRKLTNVAVKEKKNGEERGITNGSELALGPKELGGLADELVSYIMREDRGIPDSPKN